MLGNTLTELLRNRAEKYPDYLFVRFLERGEVTSTYTFSETWTWAQQWAVLLREYGLKRGDSAILALQNTDDFLGAYFGTLLVGGIPAPVVPLRRLKADNQYLETIAQRLSRIHAKILIVPDVQKEIRNLPPLSQIKNLTVLTKSDVQPTNIEVASAARPSDPGLFQFTSGTSGLAKAVQLSHEALVSQTKNIAKALNLTHDADFALSWLPVFHDMGLIGFVLTPIFGAVTLSLMPTEDFMRRPTVWLKTASDFGVTITGGPPSAYASCARFVKDADVENYDLSQLRGAFVGAEMIAPATLKSFAEKFRPAGFRIESFLPAYGLAENGLAVTMKPHDEGPVYDAIDQDRLNKHDHAKPASQNGDANVRTLVSAGVLIDETEVKIVDQNGAKLEDRRIGEILVRSTSLMDGYFEQKEATEKVLRDGWLWTGDLGYVADNQLYVTGRKKEVLIVGGNNYYPDDLEKVAEEAANGKPGSVVAFACDDANRGTEIVIILVESRLKDDSERDLLRFHVRQELVKAGFPVNDVLLLKPRTIGNTPNGKRKRMECKLRYLNGDFS